MSLGFSRRVPTTPRRLRTIVAYGRTVVATATLGAVCALLVGVADQPPVESARTVRPVPVDPKATVTADAVAFSRPARD